MNNADYGLTLQKIICDEYDIEVNDWARKQFDSSFNEEYRIEFEKVIPKIFMEVGSAPRRLLTYSEELTKIKQTTSPHNFLLENGETLSIRTVKTSDKVAPRTVGQAGFPILNEYFSELYGKKIQNQADIRKMVFDHIHEMMPVFIDCLFQSDITVFINREDLDRIQIIKANEVGNYEFTRNEFTFSRTLEEWTESITLKYHNVSIAEIQTHKERSFKFRFIVSKIPEWFSRIKTTNETFGISAEAAICDAFGLPKPDSFQTRASKELVNKLIPVVKRAFKNIPDPIQHTGSMPGMRGEQSKCSYDFILEGNLTLSLKTNKGKMVCPPEVGQPGAKTCLLYFQKLLELGTKTVDRDSFKKMVLNRIEEMMPIYVDHMFDSDWLMWIREEKERYTHQEINKTEIRNVEWRKDLFTFTKPTLEEWNESNTVKYDGVTIGEFQVHKNRDCYKFRFNLENLLKLVK